MEDKELMDTKAMAAQIPLFVEIDKEVEDFYSFLKDKNIEPKPNESLERIEKFFNKTLKIIIDLVKKSEYSREDKELLIARLILDMHGNFAEKYNINFEQLPSLLGSWNVDVRQKSMGNVAKYI